MLGNRQMLDAYASLLTWLARLLGVFCGLGAVIVFVSALTVQNFNLWSFILAIVLAGISVFIFLAKPLSGSSVEGIAKSAMGNSHVSSVPRTKDRVGASCKEEQE
jgi:hypothetical protein